MKSEIFNGQRFWTYFKYDFTQMWRNHMKACIGIGLAGLILYMVYVIFSLLLGNGWSGPGIVARLIVFILAGTALELYQTRTYGYLTDKRKGSAWLMTPASTFEKWLSMMLMTLVIMPVILMLVYLLADFLLAAIDPTVGQSIIVSAGEGFSELANGLVGVNEEYNTTWTLWTFVPMFLIGHVFNFLFFLLCGICFKKNKILNAFIIIFISSLILSAFTSSFAINYYSDLNLHDFAEAEAYLRNTMNTSLWVTGILGVGLAGGVFYRLKTLKH